LINFIAKLTYIYLKNGLEIMPLLLRRDKEEGIIPPPCNINGNCREKPRAEAWGKEPKRCIEEVACGKAPSQHHAPGNGVGISQPKK
jgi:hypothetical protein